jgi:CspA family cold shock protein
MDTGTVKLMNTSKGFGLITPDAGGQDLLFNTSAIEPDGTDIREQEKVQFETATSPNGKPFADHVSLLED